ncbi:monooxygenase, flavin-binding family [Aeromicrobium marinum DSM 15272]|uniref:Monooxygenase, flavin-binding family n=1 Tax=Aeromicrobium marinum DSM 15272 TaxID=585531 RepID=E2SCH5_9ACTN|nr:NAD(P)/FAD-dependent oxidoreductase [Aeromicrobium marinum]EFQ82928.1 monooxygenase, flavin-binding family [Aeromicrobium marinum DSM 15272]
MTTPTLDHEVAVVGAGFSGIGVAIALGRAGIFVILEDGDGVGGAWHWNTYPGVAVDIPSFSYQFSFAQRSDWSRVYAPGAELKGYAEDCVDTYGLRPKIRFDSRVTDAEFDEDLHVWRLTLRGGDTLTVRHLVGATGVLTQPKPPAIPGVDDFAGTAVHTARWDHDLDLTGQRVAVIGTGASAVQLIPSIAEQVEHLTVFQRTPIWCLPKFDAPLPAAARTALRRVPGAKAVARLLSQSYVEATFPLAAHFSTILPVAKIGARGGRAFLAQQVHDPVVREKLTPQYGLGCKRPSFSNEYLATFNRPDVALETTPIAEITATGVTTTDGVEHPVDVLVLATGFQVFEVGNMPPFPVRGRGGVNLGQWWEQNRYQAYEGATVPGFPNFFTVLGPYGYNGSSYFTLIENQARHIVRCLVRARAEQATAVEISAAAHDRYFTKMLARRPRQIFFQGTCGGSNSYYFDAHGDVPLRPSSTLEVAWRSAHFDLDDYRFEQTPA